MLKTLDPMPTEEFMKSRTLTYIYRNTLLSLLALGSVSTLTAADISLENVTKDMTFLADDKLGGRGNFTPGIEKTVDYISKRFAEAGLSPLAGAKDFKQTFNITSIKTEQLSVSINGNALSESQLAMVSTMKALVWNNLSDFTLTHIAADGNFTNIVRGLNQQGGNHLVIVSTEHKGLFSRYQSYFNRGLNKLDNTHQGAIILALVDEPEISTVSIAATTKQEAKSLTNVVGILVGKTKPKEIVLYSAHHDHLGTDESAEGDKIYNGADDDATGTTAVINLAEYFSKKSNNARTLMFTTFAAEELGGFGSQYFSKQLNPEHVVAMINIEMIGKPSKFGAGRVWMTGYERTDLGELLNNRLVAEKTTILPDPYPKFNLFYRSDNATLAKLGVPAHSFSSTQIDNDKNYHKPSDELSTIDLNSMHQAIGNLATATQGLVDGQDTPTRIDASTVKDRGKIY